MNRFVAALIATLASLTAFAQLPPQSSLREVRDRTIISNEVPKADFTFSKEFRYVGGQRINLYGRCEAEQHMFVKAGSNGIVERFYWVQFEHDLPNNNGTYDYKGLTTNLDGLSFVYDVKSWPDYAKNNAEDPGSDGEAITRLLAEHNFAFPKRAARVRMFHLPTPDQRTELMIIYGEALPEDSPVPVRPGGVVLDTESSVWAHKFLEHAARDLRIHKK